MTGWAALTAYIRDRFKPAIPERERCSFCPNRAVSHESSIDYDRVDARVKATVRRCFDHPPAGAVLKPCPHCGRPYWPDPFHFDCLPEGADRG